MANKTKDIDITKTGPVGYKDLQAMNNDDIDRFIAERQSAILSAASQSNPYRDMPQMVSSPLNSGTDYWGNSMFDNKTATEAEFQNLGDVRAENQPWYAKIGNGLAKGAVLAGTTFLDGTVGLVWGIGTAIGEGRWSGIWNNDFTNTMSAVNEWSEEAMPNYYTQNEIEHPWSNVFTSANFWGDKLIKNIGFSIGAIYGGGVISKGIKGVGKLAAIGARRLGASINTTKNILKGSSIAAGQIAVATSSVTEGSIEAINGVKDWEKQYTQVLEGQHRDNLAEIVAEYDNNRGQSFVKDSEGNIVDEAYLRMQEKVNQENNAYYESLAKMQEDKDKMGNAILLMNLPILMGSNFVQFGKLFSNGFKTARKSYNILGKPGEYVAGSTTHSLPYHIAKNALSEGSEEFGQGIATKTATNYYTTDVNNFYKAKTDREAEKETLDWMKSFGEGLVQNVGDGGAWEEFLIGAMTGAMGIPRFRSITNSEGKFQSPITIYNEAYRDWKEGKETAEREAQLVEYMNNVFKNSNTKTYYQGLIRHNKYQNDMNMAAQEGKELEFKNAEHAQLLSDIAMFDEAGKLGDLKSFIGEAAGTSKEDLESAVVETTKKTEDGKLVGPFAQYAALDDNGNIVANFGSQEDVTNMAKQITKNKEDVLSTIKQYQEIKDKFTENFGDRLDEDQLQELTWMQSQIDNWKSRTEGISGDIKTALQPLVSSLEAKLRILESYKTEEGASSTGQTENYQKADTAINNIKKFIGNLNLLRELDNKGASILLQTNPEFINDLIKQFNDLEDSSLSENDKKDVVNKLNDIIKLGEATKTYNNKLKEYLNDPQKQIEDHIKADKQNIDKATEITRTKQIEALDKTANFQEVEELINNGEATLDDLGSSNSGAARSYKKASLFRKKATELINSSDSEHKSELLDMLNRRFNENATYDDLSDESLITELPLEATTWDEKEQETLEHEFNSILNQARDKVNSGNSQKQDVEAKKTGTKRPDNVGKDDVAQPPVTKPYSVDETINKIDKINIAPEAKTEAKALTDQIVKNIEKLSKSKDPKLIRQTQRKVNALSTIVGNDTIADIIDRVRELSKSDTLNLSSQEEVLRELEAEMGKFEPTAVTGILKAVIPQFDLDAKRDGVLIPFVGDNRNSTYAYVYNKLKGVDPKTGKNAFDYVNEGNVKEGDELEVRYEPATDEHPELLALYHNGVLVNYMNTNESIEGVKEIKDKAKEDKKPTVRVSKIMYGRYGYDRTKPQSVGELLGTDDATIGVMKNRSMEANTDTFVEPVFDEANSDGKVYILLPNSKGTLSPKNVYIRHLNKTEFDLATQNNPIANDLKKVFSDLAKLANLEKGFDEALDDIYMDLIELLYIPDSFHINIISRANDISLQIAFADRDGNRQNRNILLKRFAKKSLLNIGDGTTQASEPYTASVEEVYNQVLDAFYEANLAFNVNAKKLTGKKGQEYANRLRDSNVLTTYLTGKRMQGTWFLLNEKPNTTHTDSAFERAKAAQQAKGGTRVQYGGKEYFVRNGYIYDQTGSMVDLGESAQQVKDLAYINSAYGTSYFGVNQHDGKVLIVDKNGKRGYNRATDKYLSPEEVEELEATLEGRKSKASQTATAVQSLQDSQKLVLRDDNGNPDTSNGSYMIMEEDNQYHEYQRVHSVIGSNYIGPSKGDAATSRGSLVDEIARQFLIDPTNVTKPDGMSDEAFGALKRGLGKFRDDANRRGLKLVTDRTVVFHKYPDGRRVAGELDVFAYNPSTGDISIFDFKTSKYSTKDSSFSRVENPRYFTRSNKDQYALQLSAYAKLFEDSFGVPVSNLVIVPFQLKYSREKSGGIARIFPEDYVPLTYQKGVFESTDKAPGSQSPTSLRTIKGQYVTMGTGKPEYHLADMQVLFTVGNNQTFYLAKVGDDYKLILPNGRSMTIDPSLVSDEVGRTRNNIMDFIQADNVAAAIQDAMSSTPLESSPYGNSIELKETPKETPKPDDRMKRGLDALDRLNSLKPTTPTKQAPNQEAINKREKEEKATVAIDLSTALGRSQLARKKWGEMTDAEKAIISSMFEGMEEKDIQEYWDGTDAIQRESFIPACK